MNNCRLTFASKRKFETVLDSQAFLLVKSGPHQRQHLDVASSKALLKQSQELCIDVFISVSRLLIIVLNLDHIWWSRVTYSTLESFPGEQSPHQWMVTITACYMKSSSGDDGILVPTSLELQNSIHPQQQLQLDLMFKLGSLDKSTVR